MKKKHIIKCPDCGHDLEEIPSTPELLNDLTYIISISTIIKTSLNTENMDFSLFKDNQIYEYYRAIYDNMAKLEFLKRIFERTYFNTFNIKVAVDDIRLSSSGDALYLHKN